MSRQYISSAEACALLGVSASTLKRWRHTNKLMKGVHYTQYGRWTIRYNVSWLKKFRESGGRGSHKIDVANHLNSMKQSAPWPASASRQQIGS